MVGPPKSEEVEKVESPGNSRTNLRNGEEGHGSLEIEKVEAVGNSRVWRVPKVGRG